MNSFISVLKTNLRRRKIICAVNADAAATEATLPFRTTQIYARSNWSFTHWTYTRDCEVCRCEVLQINLAHLGNRENGPKSQHVFFAFLLRLKNDHHGSQHGVHQVCTHFPRSMVSQHPEPHFSPNRAWRVRVNYPYCCIVYAKTNFLSPEFHPPPFTCSREWLPFRRMSPARFASTNKPFRDRNTGTGTGLITQRKVVTRSSYYYSLQGRGEFVSLFCKISVDVQYLSCPHSSIVL